MQSPSSPSVHNGRHEEHSHRKSPWPRLLLEAAGVMTLVLGVIATSPAGGERTQEHEVTHDFELVDMEPLDMGDDEAMMEESDDQDGSTVDPEETDTEETAFSYENCDAARDAGAAPIQEGEYGFGEHLDRDNDGTGCENWSGPAEVPEGAFQNCDEARSEGAAPVDKSHPRFGEHLDADDDGTGCE